MQPSLIITPAIGGSKGLGSFRVFFELQHFPPTKLLEALPRNIVEGPLCSRSIGVQFTYIRRKIAEVEVESWVASLKRAGGTYTPYWRKAFLPVSEFMYKSLVAAEFRQRTRRFSRLTQRSPVEAQAYAKQRASRKRVFLFHLCICPEELTKCLVNLLQWNSVKRLGATVVLVGEAYDETQAYAKQRALEEGRVFVPPFDHPDVIAGQVRAQCRLRVLESFGGRKSCPGLLRQGPTILTSSQATSCLMTSSLPGSPFVSFLRPPVELCGGAQKDHKLQAAKQRVLLKEAYSSEELQTVSSVRCPRVRISGSPP